MSKFVKIILDFLGFPGPGAAELSSWGSVTSPLQRLAGPQPGPDHDGDPFLSASGVCLRGIQKASMPLTVLATST